MKSKDNETIDRLTMMLSNDFYKSLNVLHEEIKDSNGVVKENAPKIILLSLVNFIGHIIFNSTDRMPANERMEAIKIMVEEYNNALSAWYKNCIELKILQPSKHH